MKILQITENTRRWSGFVADVLRVIMILASANGHTVSGHDFTRVACGELGAGPRTTLEHCK